MNIIKSKYFHPLVTPLIYISFFVCTILLMCNPNPEKGNFDHPKSEKGKAITQHFIQEFDTTIKSIHILVALCDNKYQGIVPVPEKIGNGQDPNNNLYWGTAYGVRTYFKRSNEWNLIKTLNPGSEILERLVFKHKTKDFYILADAYDGKYIKQTVKKFLSSSTGLSKDTIHVNGKVIGIDGNAKLIAYIGHDGLMDFQLKNKYVNEDGIKRDVIILACYSKEFFTPYLDKANVNPLVWTTGLMAPEAYTIHDALTGYVASETNDQIRIRAASAYSKYQKCSLNAAKRLLVTKPKTI